MGGLFVLQPNLALEKKNYHISWQRQELSISFCLNHLIDPEICSTIPDTFTWTAAICQVMIKHADKISALKCSLLTLRIIFYHLWWYKFTYFLDWSNIYWSLRSTLQLKLSWLHILSQTHSANYRRARNARKGPKCTAVHQRKSKANGFFTGSLWFSPTGGDHTMSPSGVVAVKREVFSCLRKILKGTV